MVPKAFLFDYGGVISAGGTIDDTPPDVLAGFLHIATEQAAELMMPFWEDYSAGRMSETALWHAIAARYGQPIPKQYWDVWNRAEAMKPQSAVLELLAELRANGYPIGLLSNVIPNTEKVIRQSGWYDLFDFVVLSNEVGYVKPEPEIYQLALKQFAPLETSEVLFLDDQDRCLAPARVMGFRTALVETPADTVRLVRSALAANPTE